MVASITGWAAGFCASGFGVRASNHPAPGNAALRPGFATGRHRRGVPERSVRRHYTTHKYENTNHHLETRTLCRMASHPQTVARHGRTVSEASHFLSYHRRLSSVYYADILSAVLWHSSFRFCGRCVYHSLCHGHDCLFGLAAVPVSESADTEFFA